MVQTILETAKDLTHSLVEVGRLSAEGLQGTLQKADKVWHPENPAACSSNNN
jgi:hypothetical protein